MPQRHDRFGSSAEFELVGFITDGEVQILEPIRDDVPDDILGHQQAGRETAHAIIVNAHHQIEIAIRMADTILHGHRLAFMGEAVDADKAGRGFGYGKIGIEAKDVRTLDEVFTGPVRITRFVELSHFHQRSFDVGRILKTRHLPSTNPIHGAPLLVAMLALAFRDCPGTPAVIVGAERHLIGREACSLHPRARKQALQRAVDCRHMLDTQQVIPAEHLPDFRSKRAGIAGQIPEVAVQNRHGIINQTKIEIFKDGCTHPLAANERQHSHQLAALRAAHEECFQRDVRLAGSIDMHGLLPCRMLEGGGIGLLEQFSIVGRRKIKFRAHS